MSDTVVYWVRRSNAHSFTVQATSLHAAVGKALDRFPSCRDHNVSYQGERAVIYSGDVVWEVDPLGRMTARLSDGKEGGGDE